MQLPSDASYMYFNKTTLDLKLKRWIGNDIM